MNIILFLLFLMIGSFMNVCIYRIPRGESISFPPSHCPACDHRLGVKDLFPLFSYLFLKGRCRYCQKKISIRYPLVELGYSILIFVVYVKFGLTLLFLKYAILSTILFIVLFIDIEHMIIPDTVNIFGAVVGFLFIFLLYLFYPLLYPMKENLIQGFLGFLVGGLIFLLIALLTNGAMGGGDIKYMAVLGLWFGYQRILLIFLLSMTIGAVISVGLLLFKIKKRKDPIPFGPFISIAAYIAILYGEEILTWYMSTILK